MVPANQSFVMRLEDSFSYTKKLGPPGSGTTDFHSGSIGEIKTVAAMIRWKLRRC